MKFETTITPEEQWNKIKKKLFKNKVPEKIERVMQKGFEESEDEEEKWLKLGVFISRFKERFID